MRVLGVDALALGKGEGAIFHPHDLLGEAPEVDLDPSGDLVVDRLMGEAGEVERAAELAVDPGEQIEIEGGGYALAVVIGGQQDRDYLS